MPTAGDTSPATTDPDPSRGRRRAVVIAVAAAAVAVAVVLVLVLAPGLFGRGGTVGPPTSSTSTPVDPDPSGSSDSSTSTPEDPAATDLPAAGPDTPEAPPVGLDSSPTVLTGVTARVKSLTSVDGTALLPGEVAGPAVRAELVLTNDSGAAIDLTTTVVNLAYGAGRTPANTFSTGTSSFTGSLDTGSSATGVYMFAVPSDDQQTVRLTLDYSVDVPVVVFEGAAS